MSAAGWSSITKRMRRSSRLRVRLDRLRTRARKGRGGFGFRAFFISRCGIKMARKQSPPGHRCELAYAKWAMEKTHFDSISSCHILAQPRGDEGLQIGFRAW